MVQFRFSALHQTSFQSAYTTVRFIIIGIIYKSHWYKRSHGKWNLRITLVQREERREKREEGMGIFVMFKGKCERTSS